MAEQAIWIVQQETEPIKIIKWKVSEGNTVPIGRIILLYEIWNGVKAEQRKLKAKRAGTLYRIAAQEGDIVEPGELLCELQECTHPTSINDMCAECGTDLRENDAPATASVPMVHSIPDLKVSEEMAQILGKADNERLLRDRKLVLLVDLDQTLIHTTNDNIPPNIKDVYHFQLYGPNSPWYHTRLRPGTHQFLENVFAYFELHICTFGARNYAHMIAAYLDPDQKFFSNRILSRDECFDPTSKKANLKALFPCGDDMVCIIDDREDVWSKATNLIHVKPYHFFQHTGDINAPPGLDKHENDEKEGVDLTKLVKSTSKASLIEEEEKKEEVKKEEEKKSDTMVTTAKITTNNNVVEKENNVDKSDGEKECDKEVHGSEESREKEGGGEQAVEEERTTTTGEMNGDDKPEQDEPKLETQTEKEKNPDTEEITREEADKQSGEDKACIIVDSEQKQPEDSSIEPKDKTECGNNGEETENVADSEIKVDGKITEETTTDQKLMEETAITENNRTTEETIIKTQDPQKQEDDLIEIEDPDCYLLYLEDILKRIHAAYYESYDRMDKSKGEIPDLKRVIPTVRSRVLKGCKLVFSGLVPTHVKLQRSKAFKIARSLGAQVTQELQEDTTHLVAIRPGTVKVNAGRRKKGLKIVTPDWLWCCAERWEHVDESIFPLSSKSSSKNRHPPPHCSSPTGNNGQQQQQQQQHQQQQITSYPQHNAPAQRRRTPSGRFMDTINPLMSFSRDDIADMDKEVEDILDDESDSSSSTEEVEAPPWAKTEITIADLERPDEESTNSSNPGEGFAEFCEFPASGKRKREDNDDLANNDFGNEMEEDLPSIKFRRGESVDDELDLDESQEDDDASDDGSIDAPDEVDDGEWNMMGAALEREFLSNN